jgi:hypothetical protein
MLFLTAAPLFYCEPLRHQQAYEQRTLDEVKRKLMQEFVDFTDDRTFAEGKEDELLGRWQYRLSKSKGEMLCEIEEANGCGLHFLAIGHAWWDLIGITCIAPASVAKLLSNCEAQSFRTFGTEKREELKNAASSLHTNSFIKKISGSALLVKPREAWQHASACHALITGSPA